MPSRASSTICIDCVRKYARRSELALPVRTARILRGRSYDRLRLGADARLDSHYLVRYAYGYEPLCQVPLWEEMHDRDSDK